MGWFSGSNPANAAQGYLNQIPGLTHQHFDPAIQQGQQAEQGLPEQYHNQAFNTGDQLNQAMSYYKPSDWYNNQYNTAMKAAGISAAGGGYLGTPADQESRAGIATSLAGQDMQQFYNNYMNMQNQGQQGLQHFGDRGFDANMGEYGNLAGNLQGQAANAYMGQQGQNDHYNNLLTSLLKLGGGAVGGLMGGPAGAMAGSQMGSLGGQQLGSNWGHYGLNSDAGQHWGQG